MRPKRFTITPDAADRNGISLAQQLGGAGDLTITGALATGGVATLDIPRHVSVYSASDLHLITFTVYGTDRYGATISEAITGPTAGATTKSTKNFATVTQVAADAAVGSDVEIGSADEFETKFYPLDRFSQATSLSGYLSSGASLSWLIQHTYDDIRDSAWSEHTAKTFDSFTTKTASHEVSAQSAVIACRWKVTSYVSGSLTGAIVGVPAV